MTYIEFKEVSFTEYSLMLKNICSLLKFKGRPLLRRVEGGFEKLNFKMAFSKEKENDLTLFMEVLAKGDFVKLGRYLFYERKHASGVSLTISSELATVTNNNCSLQWLSDHNMTRTI